MFNGTLCAPRTDTQRHILILINRPEIFRILFFNQMEHFRGVPHKKIGKKENKGYPNMKVNKVFGITSLFFGFFVNLLHNSTLTLLNNYGLISAMMLLSITSFVEPAN